MTVFEKQLQEAGDNSQQVQAEIVVIQSGIDEKRVREIFNELAINALSDYTFEASITANARNQEFVNVLIPKIVRANILEAFSDPSIQFLLKDAQRAAASTERPVDYELLSELLIHRVNKGADRNVRAGISRAVEIVDDISDEALLGLTVAHSVSYFSPSSGSLCSGLDVLNTLFSKITYSDLPHGSEWLDHLDILDAIRISQFGTLKKLQQYYPETLSGYIDVGIEENSASHTKAIEIVRESVLPLDILCKHELRDDYIRLSVTSMKSLDKLSLQQAINIGSQKMFMPIPLSESQKKAIHDVRSLYVVDENMKNDNITKFMIEWDKRESLKKLRVWWDAIDTSFNITAVGKVLAHANAQRCDPTLPALN
jgi:hypothetical protein